MVIWFIAEVRKMQYVIVVRRKELGQDLKGNNMDWNDCIIWFCLGVIFYYGLISPYIC